LEFNQIAMWKGLAAGAVNTGLALATGAKLPGMSIILAVAAIGFLSYGVASFFSFGRSVILARLAQEPISPPPRLQAPRSPSQSDKAASIGRSALRAFHALRRLATRH
jgi:hypothetical protein